MSQVLNKARFSTSILAISAGLFFAAPLGANAQLGGLFGSSASSSAGGQPAQQPAVQAPVVNTNLPLCPAMINGVPEFTLPNGDPWQPGINCVQAQTGGATGGPLDTLDPNATGTAPVITTPQAPAVPTATNPFSGSSGSSQNGATSSSASTQGSAGIGGWFAGLFGSSSGGAGGMSGSSASAQGGTSSSQGATSSSQGGPGSSQSVTSSSQGGPGSSQGATSSVQGSSTPAPAQAGTVPQGGVGLFGSSQVASTTAAGGIAATEDRLSGIHGRLGVSYVSWPDYLGADTGGWHPSMLVDLTIGHRGFLNNEDGLGFRALMVGSIESKLSVNWGGEQDFSSLPAGLTPHGNHFSLEADIVYSTLALDYELEFAKPLSEAEGWTLTGSVARRGNMGSLGSWTARLGATYASKDWNNSYYGITAAESTASGIAAYTAGGGLRDVFLTLDTDMPIGDAWGLDMGVGARRIMGDAASSPLVATYGSAMDYTGHIGVYYRF